MVSFTFSALVAELRVTVAPPCKVATAPIGVVDEGAGCAGCGTAAGGTGAWAMQRPRSIRARGRAATPKHHAAQGKHRKCFAKTEHVLIGRQRTGQNACFFAASPRGAKARLYQFPLAGASILVGT